MCMIRKYYLSAKQLHFCVLSGAGSSAERLYTLYFVHRDE
jgi:hypothetical protein